MLVERKEILNEDGSLGYIEAIFESDNILKTTYFPNAGKLYIAFNRGGTYSYENISPQLYEQFEKAESQGKFFYQNIRNKPEILYRKEFTLYPTEVRELKEMVKNNKKSIEDNNE